MVRSESVVIFSVDRSGHNNTKARSLCYKSLKQFDMLFQLATGCYKGVKEQSYVVTDPTPVQLYIIRELTNMYKQESILLVDCNRHASLSFSNGITLSLGRFIEVSEAEALQHDAWTLCNGRYFVAKE